MIHGKIVWTFGLYTLNCTTAHTLVVGVEASLQAVGYILDNPQLGYATHLSPYTGMLQVTIQLDLMKTYCLESKPPIRSLQTYIQKTSDLCIILYLVIIFLCNLYCRNGAN